MIICELEEAEQVAPSVKVFHDETAFDAGSNLIATGGHVLGVTAKGDDLEKVRDIGWGALPHKQYS